MHEFELTVASNDLIFRDAGKKSLDKAEYDTPMKGVTPTHIKPNYTLDYTTSTINLEKAFEAVKDVEDTQEGAMSTNTPLLLGVGLMVVAVAFYGMKKGK